MFARPEPLIHSPIGDLVKGSSPCYVRAVPAPLVAGLRRAGAVAGAGRRAARASTCRAGGRCPPRADVVVVGAGTRAGGGPRAGGRRAPVWSLDAEPVGWGRQHPQRRHGHPRAEGGAGGARADVRPVGPPAVREVNEAFDHVEAIVAGPTEIDCDYARTGQLYLAHAARTCPGLQGDGARARDELGEPRAVRPPRQLADEIGSTAYHGGVVLERTGGLHPARFHAGLVRRARAAAGARGRTTHVPRRSRPRPGRRRAPGRDRSGRDRGRATWSSVHQRLRRRAAARAARGGCCRSAASSSPPRCSTPELAEAVSPRRRMLVDTQELPLLLAAHARRPDAVRRPPQPGPVDDRRRPATSCTTSMLAVHPQLAGVRGRPGLGRQRGDHARPLAARGPVDGAWYATGCNGSGVALNTWMGMRIGRHLAGDGPPPAFAELPHRPIPLHRWRRAYLPRGRRPACRWSTEPRRFLAA